MSALAPPRPRARLAHVGGTLWNLSFGVLRDFVWADLRDGIVDVRGLPATLRSLIWFAAFLLAIMIVALLFGDFWRAQWPLVPTPRGTPGRGSLVPSALLPTTVLLFAVGWCLILTGGLYAGAKTRLAIVGLFVLTMANWAELPTFDGWAELVQQPTFWTMLGATVAIALVFARPRRARRHPLLAFVLLLLLLSLVLVPTQAQNLDTWRILTGIPLLMSRMEADVTSLRLLVMPLLLLIGIDVATFIRQVAGWTTEVVAERLPRRAPWILLAALLLWRLRDVLVDGAERAAEISLAPALLAYAGGLLAPIVIGLAWWAVARLAAASPPAPDATARLPDATPSAAPGGADSRDAAPRQPGVPTQEPDLVDAVEEAVESIEEEVVEALPELSLTEYGGPDPEAVEVSAAPPRAEDVAEAAESWALLLVLAYTAFGVVSFIAGGLASLLASLGFFAAVYPLIAVAGLATAAATPWFIVVDIAALVVGLRLAWRDRVPLAVYLVSFAVLRLWWEATRPGRPLGALDSLGWETVDAWWVVLGAGLALWWAARGRLTRERALALVFLLLVTAVVRQTDFIENKFTPLFGWAGVGFIAFGLAWDALTKGAWANRGTPALPKPARILIYLGYALLTVTVVNWSLATHDLFNLRLLTGGGALLGFAAFGRPMLYAVLVATLVAATRAGQSGERQSA